MSQTDDLHRQANNLLIAARAAHDARRDEEFSRLWAEHDALLGRLSASIVEETQGHRYGLGVGKRDLAPLREQVLSLLREHPNGLTPRALHAKVAGGYTYKQVREALRVLYNKWVLTKTRAVYRIATEGDHGQTSD